MREAFESGDPPSPDVFTETLAEELGLSEEEVADALSAAREATFEERFGKRPPPMLEFRREPGDLRRDLPPPPDFGVFPGAPEA
jgi:hypothetical protein